MVDWGEERDDVGDTASFEVGLFGRNSRADAVTSAL